MKTSITYTILLCFLYCLATFSQNVNRPTSYNYLRGVEATQNEQYDEAIEYFNKDLRENPKSGYSYYWISQIRLINQEYGLSLDAVNTAIKNLPKKDKEYVVYAYITRAEVYLNLEDTVTAIKDYTTAIGTDPSIAKSFERRAELYFQRDQYGLSDIDYKKLIEIRPGNPLGYIGLGRNAYFQKRWDDGIKQCTYALKLDKDYPSAYYYRAQAYIGKKMWSEATDDIVSHLELDLDQFIIQLACELEEPAFTMLIHKLKIRAAKSPNVAVWPFFIGTMFDNKGQNENAIEYYQKANDINEIAKLHNNISACYENLGNYEAALNSINSALNMDSTIVEFYERKANILYELGDIKAAIAEYDKAMAVQPAYETAYFGRGVYKGRAGDFDGAIEDLSVFISFNTEEAYAYASRADIYLKQGKKDLADADFRKIIEIEDSPEKYDRIPYGYQGLAMNDKAIAAMDTIIARDTTDYGNFYDAACLYSRMQKKEDALKYLEKSLELGYKDFGHINQDYDMDFLRNTTEFKALIEKYKPKTAPSNNGGTSSVSNVETVTTEIPFTKEAGVCKVKCKINDLPLHFVFDTGASEVTISMVEANFMIKNGYLSGNDVIGSQHYMDANGNVSVGTVVNLKSVNFGGLELKNIRASVVRNQKAPLLLGQSVFGRLGRIEIDNTKRILKITHSK